MKSKQQNNIVQNDTRHVFRKIIFYLYDIIIYVIEHSLNIRLGYIIIEFTLLIFIPNVYCRLYFRFSTVCTTT